MKLIIDIDNNEYELINKTCVTYDWHTVFHGKEKDKEMTLAIFDLVKALKNGTPYEERPQGNLISRDALKKDIDFQFICECCHNNGNTCDICPVAEIEKKIEEAPTVEEKSYAMGYQDGAQGEFLPYMECDKCHEEFLLNMLRPAEFRKVNRFCSNCGADMRGKKE